MRDLPAHPDILIIGAGAAGIAAGRQLAAAGASFVIIEARSRAGGRAWTQMAGGYPLDMGCGWFHSAEHNPIALAAMRAGIDIDRSLPPWQKDAWVGNFPLPEQRAYRRAWAQLYERLGEAARDGVDGVASECLEPGNRWNGLLDAGSSFVNGVELEGLSRIDYDRYHDSGVNWRAPIGMGASLVTLAAGLPVKFDCIAQRVDHCGARVRVATGHGDVSARAVIVTLSTNLLARGAVQFTPSLPDKTQAAARLPLGLADKLFLAVQDARDLPGDGRLYGQREHAAMASYHLRPFGRPLIEAYFGGKFAHELEAGGVAAFADYAIADIAGALGHDMARRLSLVAGSTWGRDAFALGSYSHALPGFSDARAVLAAPVNERIFFAGEATSKHDFSTAHGAWRSGERAAAEALASCV